MKSPYRYLSYIFSVTLLCIEAIAHATTTDYLIVSDLPFISDPANVGLGGYLKALFQLGIGIAVTLAIVMLVVNGIHYMFSDIPGIKVSAKNNLGSIIWGLILAFSAWLILYTINPNLVEFDLVTSLREAAEEAAKDTGNPRPDRDDTESDGEFTYQDGIAPQRVHASEPLNELLSCMADILPGNVGDISSISDSAIMSGARTFRQCAQGNSECDHHANSQHYGGHNCVGSSYAVDFGDEWNGPTLIAAARECEPGVKVKDEGNHIHMSVGTLHGCGGNL